jgi:hypothetical protein
MSHFGTSLEQLPASLPVFPLSGVMILPRGRLPLNIFEPRYLDMTGDALAGARLIGMIQPKQPEETPVTVDGDIKDLDDERLPLYDVGCAGRIVNFEETEDGRYLVALLGVCRFTRGEEIETEQGYRRFAVDWSAFHLDLDEERDVAIDREELTTALKPYFKARNISADWDAIAASRDEQLVTALSMMCPFGPAEKQALLEAPDLENRCELLTTLAGMAAHDDAGARPPQ